MDSNLGHNTVELSVSGMSCGHCKRSVEDALSELCGVSEISVDLENGRASFQLAADTDREAAIEAAKAAITDIGFDVD